MRLAWTALFLSLAIGSATAQPKAQVDRWFQDLAKAESADDAKPIEDKIETAFRQSGKLEVSYAGLRYGVTAKPQEKAGVERFFAACEGRRTRKCGSAVTISAKVWSGVVTEIFESNSKVPRRLISPRLSTWPSGEMAHKT